MRTQFKVLLLSLSLFSFAACSNKDKMDDPADAETSTPATNPDNTTIIIKDDGEMKVDSKEGSNVEIDLNKKGGSITVDDGDNKIDVKVKDDNKK